VRSRGVSTFIDHALPIELAFLEVEEQRHSQARDVQKRLTIGLVDGTDILILPSRIFA
jgi:hypothetical protein